MSVVSASPEGKPFGIHSHTHSTLYNTRHGLPSVLSIDEFKEIQTAKSNDTYGSVNRLCWTWPSQKVSVNIISRSLIVLNNLVSSVMWSILVLSLCILQKCNLVVDKYHYIRQVIWAFEAVRKKYKSSFHQPDVNISSVQNAATGDMN